MSKMRNLFAGFICLVLALVCLASCITEAPEMAAKKQAETDAQEVLNKLVWDEEDRTAIVSSLVFATENRNYPGVSISWTSSEEDIISSTGKVNRPNSDDERNVLVGEDLVASVIITATVVAEYTWEENGTHTATTDPIAKQFEFTVLAKPEGTDVGTIEDVKLRAWNYIYVEQGVDKALVSNSSITYNVLLSGVITAKLNADGATKGFMLHDGTDGIYVYGDNTKFNVGDSVEVIGGVYSYYGSLQVGSNVSVSKSNEKFTLPAYKEVTPQAWEDQNKDLGDDVIGHLGGDLYKVEGYLTASYNATTKDEFCITDANTGEVSWIYYKSYNAEMKAQLEAYVGKYVKVTGLGYDRDSRVVKNHLLWDGGIEEASAPVVDDQTKVNVALSQISLKDAYDADFDLSAAGVWEVVSGTGVEIAEGVAKVTRGDEDQVVVLKVTVTVGEVTGSKEFTVTVKAIVKETPKHAGTKEDPYSVSDAVLIAGELADQEKTDTVYAIGTIKEITDLSLSYGNATFTITDGVKDIIVFRAKYLNNEKFTAEDQIKVGDVVVIVGQLTNWGGTLEFNSGCYIDSFSEAVVEGPFKTDYAYKFEVVQGNTGQTLYLTGNYKNTYYGESTTDKAAAADVYVVAVEGGYNLKLVQTDGTVLYINIVASGTHRNIKFEAAASSVWNYNEEYETFTTLVEGTEYYVGTYGTYDTISPSSIDKAATSFVGHLVAADGTVKPEPPVHEHEFVEGKCECGEVDPDYVAPEQPVAGDKVELNVDVLGLDAYADGSKEVNGVQFDYIELGSYGNGIQWRNKTKTSQLWNATAFAKAIVKIELVYNAAQANYANANALKIQFGTDSSVAGYETYLSTEKGGSLYTITPNAETYTFVKFTINITYSLYFDSITIYFADGDVVTPEPPVHEHEFVEGKCECGEVDPNYVAPEQPTFGVVTEFEENVAYKFGLVQGNTGKTIFVTGGYKNTYYGESTEDVNAAADVYVIAVDGGYNLKLVKTDGTVLYINVVASGTHKNIKFEAAASSVWTYNAELNTFTTIVADAEVYIGTYGTYDTISPSTIDKAATSFVGHLYGGNQAEAPHEHEFVEGKCECGEVDPNYVAPEVPGDAEIAGKADLETIKTSMAQGDSSYTKTFTTEAGWVSTNAAIQTGNTTDINPQFTVIGPDMTHKAVCLNGKVSAAGSLVSPTLAGGISKLTFNWSKVFSDTKIKFKVTITDLATGAAYEYVVDRTFADGNDGKYALQSEEFVLETPITGDFKIEFVNECPSGATGNKDRATIFNIAWYN